AARGAITDTIEDMVGDVVALDGSAADGHLSIAARRAERLRAVGVGTRPGRQIREFLLHVGGSVVAFRAHLSDRGILGLRVRAIAGLQCEAELEVAGAVDAQRVARPNIGRYRGGRVGRARGLASIADDSGSGPFGTTLAPDAWGNIGQFPLARG